MAQRKLPARSDITSLLALTEDNPQLPAYIRRLAPVDLIRLVDYLGKEDAQALLRHATANQIAELVETDAWSNAGPGTAERFSPQKFMEWLELWNESGATVLCQRLKELGSELFALTLHEYLVVVDTEEVGISGPSDRFGRYALIPKNEDIWPLLFEYISHIHGEDPEYLEEVLGICCLRRSLTVEKAYATHNENLALDVEAARDRHRRERGYVTSMSSAAFLKRIRLSNLDALLMDGSYDGYSAMQLRNMQQLPASDSDQPMDAVQEDQEGQEGQETRAYESNAAPSAQALEELQALLGPILKSPALDLPLLDGPGSDNHSYLERQLARLEADKPELAQARFTEILYLSNILMEGITVAGVRLEQRDAMLATKQTVNLGLTYCIFEEPWLSEEEMLAELLEREPGLIKAFNVGYRLLMDLAQNVEQALGAALQDKRVARRLNGDPELAAEIRGSFARYRACRRAGSSSHEALQQATDSLSILLDNSTCVEISLMADDFPRFPGSLAPGFEPGIRVNRIARFISEPGQLKLLRDCLVTLTDRLLL